MLGAQPLPEVCEVEVEVLVSQQIEDQSLLLVREFIDGASSKVPVLHPE
jgi:hypothetical protein